MSTVTSPFHVTHAWWRRALIAAMVLVVLFLVGYWPRYVARKALARESAAVQQNLPRAKVTAAVVVPGERSLTLPGNLVALQQAFIDARATGYVARWHADIGDRVHAGDVLAELETPELDQELEQARSILKQKEAALEQAIANRAFAQVTATREDALLAESLSSQQNNDQAHAQVHVWEANVHAAKADVAASQASVRQFSQLLSFGRVVAPFDGRITQRNIDVGSLVTAGTSGGSGGPPLFRIEATDPIRVFVQVPQAFSLSVKATDEARISIRQLRGRVFKGQVTRTAGTLDPSSRTLNTEIEVPNPTGELLSGMFAEVTIAAALSHRVIRVPSSAVVSDARGVHVATVDAAGQVHLIAVTPGIDNGRTIDVVDGLDGTERVLVNPGGDLTDGMKVEPVMEPR